MKTIRCALSILLLAAVTAASAFTVTPSHITMSEYVNELTGHYVLLDSSEGMLVDAGSAGPGWIRTGQAMSVPNPSSPLWASAALKPVCRFYSPVNNSHFITADAAECELLKNPASEWKFEKIAFYVLDVGPHCPAEQLPVYRTYNGRAAAHDANHRFTMDAATRDEMLAAGWIDEGVAFCSRGGGIGASKSFIVFASLIADARECESHVGSCIALKQLAPMTNLVPAFLPPFFVSRNPDYPAGAQTVTGTGTDLFTARPATEGNAIASHSFVQTFTSGSSSIGLHLAGDDRLSGSYASIGPMYELPGAAPAAGGIDQRIFPWPTSRHHSLVASFDLKVPTIVRADATSHAYGALLLQFGDAASGHSFYVTIQAYGTVPPVDFVARDSITGLPIVSTVFRANPSFGTRISGDFAACTAGTPCIAETRPFDFRIEADDFVKILAQARTVDPDLSPDISHYFVGQFRMHNETFGSARLGATVEWLQLHLWY